MEELLRKAEADLARVEEETVKCAPDIMESVSKDVKTTGWAYDDVFQKLSRTTLNDTRRTVEALRLHIKTQGSEKTRQVLLQRQEVHQRIHYTCFSFWKLRWRVKHI
jgi:hypothetical protein